MMSSLNQCAKKAGVSPQAVRGWLDRTNLAAKCWDEVQRRYFIPEDIEAQVIAYYRGANNKSESPTNQAGEASDELLTILREQLAVKDKQIADLTALLSEAHTLLGEADIRLGEAHRRLGASQTLQGHTQGLIVAESGSQQWTGAQQSPHAYVVHEQKRNRVRDFVTRLTGR